MADETQSNPSAPIATGLSVSNELARIVVHLAQIAQNALIGMDGVQADVRNLFHELSDKATEAGYDATFESGFRTISEQNALYAEGRTTAGAVVTNAEGYQSYHNYGLAFDIALSRHDGVAIAQADWATVGALGESLGLVWGGTFGDNSHFEYHPSFTWEDLRPILDLATDSQ